jgi:hypothetical protein
MPLPSVHNVFKLGSSLIVAGAILLGADPASALGARANYVEIASWETGYQAQYTITNDGPGNVTHWRVVFDLPGGSSPSSSWDSVRSGSAQHLVFDNAAWNGSLAPGSSTTFGFVVVGLGRPVGCTVNGGPCDTFPPFAMAPARDVRPGLARDRSAVALMELAPFDVNATPSGPCRAHEPARIRRAARRAGAGGRAGQRTRRQPRGARKRR